MATIEDPGDWRFARWEVPVADCAEQLKLLQKHLKARLKKMDPGSWKCVKLNGESDVHFHRIDVERASQCLTLVVHRFPVEDATTLDACGSVAHQQRGYYFDFVSFEQPGITCEWIKKEQAGNSSVAWEQTADPGTADPGLWRALWRGAAQELGILEALSESNLEGLPTAEISPSVPFSISTPPGGTRQTVDDFGGVKLVVLRQSGPKLTLWLGTPEPHRARSIWSKCAMAAESRLGPINKRFMNLEYNGRDRSASERLNELMPIFDLVNYNLWDSEQDKFYRKMLQPLTLPAGGTRAFPAMAVTEDDLSEKPHLIVNVVRSSLEAWLEFQTDQPERFFPEVERALGGTIEVWTGKAARRWSW